METSKTHIYFVPGLAASSKIFEYIKVPEEKYEMHFLEWLIPLSQSESIEHYAKRMCDLIEHKNPVLIGVSFGGIMVQEMSKLITTQKIIIISSVKTKNEIPKRLKLARITKAYKLFPTKSIINIESFSKYIFGDFAKRRVELYKIYLSMRDDRYLNWSIYNILNWKQKNPLPNIIHIHGKDDHIFPIKHIKDCICIEHGSHVMILNKAKTINKILLENL